ncbi:unnamed protein product [Aphanomyces euteiches]|nr:hypothetical protein AeRB84_009931 [Aphanomyces euteiches]
MDDDDLEALLHAVDVPSPDTTADHLAIELLHDETKRAVDNERDYVEEFDGIVPAAEVVVASIPVEVIQQREAEMERARIQKAQDEAKEYQMRETLLAYKEEKARARLDQAATLQKQKLAQRELQSLHVVTLQSKQLLHVYHQAETHMKHVLSQQQAHVQDTFGSMETTRAPAHKRRYRAEWARIPQPIEIHIHMLRAVKDKLPIGHYVILATLYDRLGGHPITWTVAGDRGVGAGFPGLTTPLLHRGRFYDTEFAVGQNVHVVCPPQIELRPANVVLFEVYMLSNNSSSETRDVVVAWGVLPVCNADFDVVAGCFKVPLIRGDVDHTISKFRDIEHMHSTDLSSWLCNMYVTVRHLPRERLDAAGILQREYDVELDFMNQLLKLDDTTRKNLAQDGQESSWQRRRRRKGSISQPTMPRSVDGGSIKSMNQRRKAPNGLSKVAPTIQEDDDDDKTKCHGGTSLPLSPPSSRSWRHWFRRRRKRNSRESVPRDLAAQNATTDDVHDDDEDDDTGAAAAPAHARTWEGFTFSTYHYVDDQVAKHERFQSIRKLRYLQQELFADMGLQHASTWHFWLLMVFLLLALWLRVYIHYLGQWLYLRGSNVPVFDFRPQLVTCVLKYTWDTIPTATEIGVITVGVLFNMLAFAAFMATAWLCQHLIGEFPDIGSNFIACFGLATVFDPLLVLAVDLIQHNYDCGSTCTDPSAALCTCIEGDAFKLYKRFKSQDGSGVVGVVLTLLLYGILMCAAAVVFYTYLLHFHMNGRMLDVYRRVHAREGVFFVPNDFEVSAADVALLCEKAARWKSIKGTQRKTAVCEYELRDPADPSFVETTVHIAIFNLELDGSRQLYRHFIKNPDGEILEVFGTISDSLGSQYSTLEPALFQTAPPEDGPPHIGLFDVL